MGRADAGGRGREVLDQGRREIGRRSAGGRRVEVSDATGKVVASGTLGETPLAGTEALYWTALDVPAPASQASRRIHRALAPARSSVRFSVAAAAKPEHTLTVRSPSGTPRQRSSGVEIRLGPFHARTDKAGRAELRVCKGEYQLQLWRTAHIAQPKPIKIDGDMTVELTMVHVPEEHPDARWVR